MDKIIISSKSKKIDYVGFPVTLNKDNQLLTGIVILSILGGYHVLLTKDKRYIKINWTQNSEQVNNKIFSNFN